MAIANMKQIRQELAMVLRNEDVITTTLRGVTTITETPVVIASQTSISLSSTIIRNIRSFTVDSVKQIWITDYSIDFSTGVITMVNGFSGGETVSIQYDYGGTEKIYPDFPRDELKLSSFPRVGVSNTSGSTVSFDLGANTDITDLVMTIFCLVPSNKDSSVGGGLGGTDDLSDMVSNVRTAIANNRQSFSQFPFIRIIGGPNPVTYSRDNKVIMQSQDVMIQFLVE